MKYDILLFSNYYDNIIVDLTNTCCYIDWDYVEKKCKELNNQNTLDKFLKYQELIKTQNIDIKLFVKINEVYYNCYMFYCEHYYMELTNFADYTYVNNHFA